MLPREDTLSSDNSPKPFSKDSSSCGDLSIPEVDVLWIGNVYKYTDPKLSVLTVLLHHIRCRSTAYPSTVQVFDAFIKQTEIDIVVPTSLRMFKYCTIEVSMIVARHFRECRVSYCGVP